MQLDILTIGDLVVDDFIRLTNAYTSEDGDLLCVDYREKVPFESSTIVYGVGNSPNAAVSGARLGLRTALMAVVGNDDNGKKCIASLQANGVQTQYIGIEQTTQTNYHYVLWFENDRTILINHHAYTYAFPALEKTPKAIYLSSLGKDALSVYDPLLGYLNDHPEVKFIFQPGTYQINHFENFKDFLPRSFMFIANKKEYQTMLGVTEEDPKALMALMKDRGPTYVVMTDGPNGLYATDGTRSVFLPMYPDPRPAFERTGAGDACASTIAAALLDEVPFEEALLWGPINSMCVVQQIGAQKGLLSRDDLLEYLDKAPSTYRLTDI